VNEQTKNSEPIASEGRERGPAPVLSYGFRPFFLAAGAYGALSLAFWVGTFAGIVTLPTGLAPSLWHGHEMLFGFAAAVNSGFLLTAVSAWTGSPPINGGRLASLVALWLVGRVAFWLTDFLTPFAVAALDLIYIPVLIIFVIVRLLGAGQRRNLVFPILLGLLFAANLLYHLEAVGWGAGTARVSLHMSVYVFALLIAAISGRIVPSFTANALKELGDDADIRSIPVVEKLVMVAMVTAAVADLLIPGGTIAGGLALVAAILLTLRMRYWGTLRVLNQPILWILHLGHVWLVAAFACSAVSGLTGLFPAGATLHAFTSGAIGTTVIGMMTRVALGHTGRELKASPITVVAYFLVTGAALVRVAAVAFAPLYTNSWILASGVLWSLAFALYVVIYWPVLTGPRINVSSA
jgi:uncharacterized protein involved in response to NO